MSNAEITPGRLICRTRSANGSTMETPIFDVRIGSTGADWRPLLDERENVAVPDTPIRLEFVFAWESDTPKPANDNKAVKEPKLGGLEAAGPEFGAGRFRLWRRWFVDHPSSVNESYFEHMGVALGFSRQLAKAAVAAFCHALVPALFTKTASSIVVQLHDRIVINRVTKPPKA